MMIKRICLLIAILALASGISKGESSLKLVFLATDNSVTEIEASSLAMSVNGEKLSVSNETENMEFQLSELVKMYFTTDQSGVELIPIDFTGTQVRVYSLEGHYAGIYSSISAALSSLPKGVYIMNDSKGKPFKIAVK